MAVTTSAVTANPLLQVVELGQSIWYDQMRRALVTSGELKKMIDQDGLRGLTSNPTIFEKAIGGSNDYADDLRRFAKEGKSVDEIYEQLVVKDISMAAELFRGVYEHTKALDGYCSLEVSPRLAYDTKGTIAEAKRLFSELNHPNVMIKIPATPQGLPAIVEVIAAGINVNVTLIFSREVYEQVAEAFIQGLEKRLAAGQSVKNIASVASFFVSRIDTAAEKKLSVKLSETQDPAARARMEKLFAKVAVANAKMAYESFKNIFHGERFAKLRAAGAQVQRQLWASTSTKNPKYKDVMYVEELIGPETVDTVPPQTFDAFRDHGIPRASLAADMNGAKQVLADLEASGVSLKQITEELTSEGVKSFMDSFEKLMEVIESRRDEAISGLSDRHTASIGNYAPKVQGALKQMEANSFTQRVWKKDAPLWKSEPEHQAIIKNALGWLTVVDILAEHASEVKAFAEEIRKAGFQHVVVLGMGGSSLCPEVLRRTFGRQKGWPELHVLDSTVPSAVSHMEKSLDLAKSLFIVASKSGGTTEPQMFHHYFYARVKEKIGDRAGQNFIAITDPNTALGKEAARDNFRRVFLNPADIGGRYSALSFFGMVPFALMGGDLDRFLDRAHHAMHACAAVVPAADNPGAKLGAALGTMANDGRDKLTLIAAKPIDSVGLWIEQLIAESTGKEGKGIVPIAGEPLGAPAVYGNDRIFVYLHCASSPDKDAENKVAALEKAGHPVLRHELQDEYDLAEEFFVWEFATAVAGQFLGINPFDQPNVQESKDNTKRLIGELNTTGKLPEQHVIAAGDGIRILSDPPAQSIAAKQGEDLTSVLAKQLTQIKAGDYVALTAYIEDTADNDAALQRIRTTIRDRFKVATTTGYGPRFLHSTGQLHKGGANNGVFIQMTAPPHPDLPIPGESFTFGQLNQAQSLGDFQSLAKRQRRAVRVDLGADVGRGLQFVEKAAKK